MFMKPELAYFVHVHVDSTWIWHRFTTFVNTRSDCLCTTSYRSDSFCSQRSLNFNISKYSIQVVYECIFCAFCFLLLLTHHSSVTTFLLVSVELLTNYQTSPALPKHSPAFNQSKVDSNAKIFKELISLIPPSVLAFVVYGQSQA